MTSARLGPLATLVLSVALASETSAKSLHLGIAAGANYSMLSGTSSVLPLHTAVLTGFSYSGAVTLSFFQDSVFGFQISEDLANTNMTAGSDSFTARMLYTSIIPRFSFDLGPNRHSLGIGYAYGIAAATGTISTPYSLNAVAIEGKDMWKVGDSHYIFLAGRVFIPIPAGSIRSMLNCSLLLGFDL